MTPLPYALPGDFDRPLEGDQGTGSRRVSRLQKRAKRDSNDVCIINLIRIRYICSSVFFLSRNRSRNDSSALLRLPIYICGKLCGVCEDWRLLRITTLSGMGFPLGGPLLAIPRLE